MLGQSGGLSLLSGAVPWLVAALVPWGPGAFLDPVQTPAVAREGVQEPEKGSRSWRRGPGAISWPRCRAAATPLRSEGGTSRRGEKGGNRVQI